MKKQYVNPDLGIIRFEDVITTSTVAIKGTTETDNLHPEESGKGDVGD